MQKRISNNVLLLIFRIYVLVPALIYWGNPSPKPPGADGIEENIQLYRREYTVILIKLLK